MAAMGEAAVSTNSSPPSMADKSLVKFSTSCRTVFLHGAHDQAGRRGKRPAEEIDWR